MSFRKQIGILAAAASLGIAGCATDPYSPNETSGPGYPRATYPAYDTRYGYVESIETLPRERRGSGPGVGAIGGAVAGGILGNQVGSGSGNTAATIGGAVIGGVVGHQVEQRVRDRQASGDVDYVFRVRLDDGSYRSVRKDTHAGIRVGDRVRVERDNIYPL